MQETLLDWLKNPTHFPCGTQSIEVIQTHISIVCIADELVYKIKKPVRFSFLDFSTLEQRKFYCEEELRLNRRLCTSVYLDVIPIYSNVDGGFSFESGEIVDWAVVMKKLPAKRLMSRCLKDHDPGLVAGIGQVAKQVANFHQSSTSSPEIRTAGSPEKLIEKIRGNFDEDYPKNKVNHQLLQSIQRSFEANIPTLQTWLSGRSDKIVEGHGDLHSGNIFLSDPPTIFDCIEF